MKTFLSKIIKLKSGCWEWTGNKNKKGAPRIFANGKVNEVVRFSWQYFVGEIENGLCVTHKCNSRYCINPEHLTLRRKKIPREERFYNSIEIPSNKNLCWLWKKNVDKDGYGRIDNIRSNRYSYELHKGEIPEGLCVCHTCDNPPCCNPDHLWIGTVGDNTRDMVRKGRRPNHFPPSLPGILNPKAKLTEDNIKQIRQKHKAGMNYYDLAKLYNVTDCMIGKIVRYECWKHII